MPRLPACLLATLLLCAPVAAGAAEPAADSAAADWLGSYNRIVFAFNSLVYSLVDSLTAGPDETSPGTELPAPDLAEPKSSGSTGPGRMISNLVNEPLTALSSLAVGDLPTAWNAAQRFGINSTVGVLGWWDEASARGYKPVAADVGLSLCRLGVGEGGYVMLPFIGPRTYRDAASDVILVNALLWTATAAVFSSGFSLQTIIIAESIEVVADIVATRQIDPRAKELHFDNFEKMRADYLAQRRLRCASDSAMAVAAAANIP
jgi:phospholipid-binding lipoprotein MlaA